MSQTNYADVEGANTSSAPNFIVIPAFETEYRDTPVRFTKEKVNSFKENPKMINQKLFNEGFGKEIRNFDPHLFMVDYDNKNDPSLEKRLSNNFYLDFEEKLKGKCLEKFGEELDFKENWDKIVFEKSKSGGLHFYFTCQELSNKDFLTHLAKGKIKNEKGIEQVKAFIELLLRLTTVPIPTKKSPFECKRPSEFDKMKVCNDKTIDHITELPKPFVETIFEVLQSYNEYVEPTKEAEPEQKKAFSTQRNEFSNTLQPWRDFLDRESNIDKYCEITGFLHKGNVLYKDESHQAKNKALGAFYADKGFALIKSDTLIAEIGNSDNVYKAFKRIHCQNDSKIAYKELLKMGYGSAVLNNKYQQKAKKIGDLDSLTDEQIHNLVKEYWEEGRDGEAFMLVKYYDSTVKYSELLKENGFYRYGNGCWASTSGMGLQEDAREKLKSMFTISLKLELISIEKRKELELETITDEEDKIDKAREFDKIKRNTEKTYKYRIEILCSYSFKLSIFQGKPQILIPPKEHFTTFDYNKTLINFQNGTLNIGDEKVKSKFYAHEMADMLTYKLDYDYDSKNTSCPHFMNHLEKAFCGDQELIDYFQMCLGYCLSGRTDSRIFFYWWGAGGYNGKGILKYIISSLLGSTKSKEGFSLVREISKACVCEPNRNTNQNSIDSQMFDIPNTRIVFADEIDANDVLDGSKMKTIAAGELIMAKRFHHDPISIYDYGKFTLISNHLPRTKERNNSFYERMRLIPFNYTFLPEERKNKAELEKLINLERSAIFNWVFEGYTKLLQMGFIEFANWRPSAMREAINDFITENDPLQTFLSEKFEKDAKAKMQTKDLFNIYQEYVKEKSDSSSEMYDGGFVNLFLNSKKLTSSLKAGLPNAIQKGAGNNLFLLGYKLK